MQRSEARRLKQIMVVQAVLASVLGLMALAIGLAAAMSAAIGGGASLTANFLGALWAFRDYTAREPERILMRFYGAEVVKISVMIAILATALATLDGLNVPILLGAFFVVQVVTPLVAAQLDTPQGPGPGAAKQK